MSIKEYNPQFVPGMKVPEMGQKKKQSEDLSDRTKYIPVCDLVDKDFPAVDAKRIQACVHACHNLPTAFLEAGGVELAIKACTKIHEHMVCVGTLGHGIFDELNEIIKLLEEKK